MRISTALFFFFVLAGSAIAGPEPCSLVTKAEVQEAAGASASDGVVNAHNKAVCDFKVGQMGSLISVMLVAKAPGDSAERTVAELKKRKISATVMPGFGDSAYASSPGYGMQQLGAYKGSSQVLVTVLMMGASEDKSKTVMQAVMRKALARVK